MRFNFDYWNWNQETKSFQSLRLLYVLFFPPETGKCEFTFCQFASLIPAFIPSLRAHACLAWPDSVRDPATAAGPSVGATRLQPHPLSHVHLVPVLPLLHANRGQRRKQRYCQRVPVCGTQHVSLHPEGPAAVPFGPRPASSGQSRRQEGEQRGYLPDGGRQWVGGSILAAKM